VNLLGRANRKDRPPSNRPIRTRRATIAGRIAPKAARQATGRKAARKDLAPDRWQDRRSRYDRRRARSLDEWRRLGRDEMIAVTPPIIFSKEVAPKQATPLTAPGPPHRQKSFLTRFPGMAPG